MKVRKKEKVRVHVNNKKVQNAMKKRKKERMKKGKKEQNVK